MILNPLLSPERMRRSFNEGSHPMNSLLDVINDPTILAHVELCVKRCMFIFFAVGPFLN
jgi:hypothetical protein